MTTKAEDYLRIQNKLIEIVRGDPSAVPTPIAPIASFWGVTLRAEDDERFVKGSAILPAAVEADEVAGTYDEPERNRRWYQRDFTSWTWQLRIGFHEKAILTDFEAALNERPVLLPASLAGGLRQVSLELTSAAPVHPVRHGAKGGTRVVYTINAKLWPL